jgi:hypothetical protein
MRLRIEAQIGLTVTDPRQAFTIHEITSVS